MLSWSPRRRLTLDSVSLRVAPLLVRRAMTVAPANRARDGPKVTARRVGRPEAGARRGAAPIWRGARLPVGAWPASTPYDAGTRRQAKAHLVSARPRRDEMRLVRASRLSRSHDRATWTKAAAIWPYCATRCDETASWCALAQSAEPNGSSLRTAKGLESRPRKGSVAWIAQPRPACRSQATSSVPGTAALEMNL